MHSRYPSHLPGLLALLLLGGRLASPGAAQVRPPASPTRAAPPPAAGVGVGPTLVDTTLVDTTVRPGRQDLAPYTTPGHCLAAAQATEALARRTAVDSASYQPERDTLAAATVASARRCGARFTPEQVSASELLDLMHLALMAGDDAHAHTAAERYLTAITEPEAYRWALYAVDTTYLSARPMRRAAAEAVTARLDALGPAAALQRKVVHERLLEDARQRYDVALLQREGLAVLTACHQLSPQDSRDVESTCTEASLVLELFLAELYRNPQGAVERTRHLVSAAGFTAWDTFQKMMYLVRLDWTVAQQGKPVPPLQAAGRGAGWPVRGKVSIYLRGNPELDNPQTMARWKRLGEEFKDAVNITVLVVGSGAEGFYREQLGLSVTVVSVERPVRLTLPPPDGRRILGEPPLLADPYYGSAFLLVDRAGQFLLGPFLGEEALVHAWVARAVGH